MKRKECYKCGSDKDIRLVNPSRPTLNTHMCKTCQNIKAKAYYDKYRNLVFTYYGEYCSCCAEDESLFLSIDHVNNDGHLDLNSNGKTLTGRHLYPKIVKLGYPDKYQVLCMNCNFGKRMNNGICPHKTIDKKS